jgi:membrane-associated phospholipid phosphatase
MNRRQLLFAFFVAIVLTLLGIFLLDQPVAAFVQRTGSRQSVILQQGTPWLEVASGYDIARYVMSYVLLAAGALLFVARSTRPAGWILLFVGCSHLFTRLTAGVLKNVFDRLRPFEVIQAGDWDWKFFTGHGNSFPSGHSAQFWGLFFPFRLSLSASSAAAPDRSGLHFHRAGGSERSLVQRCHRVRRVGCFVHVEFRLALPNPTKAGQPRPGDRRD